MAKSMPPAPTAHIDCMPWDEDINGVVFVFDLEPKLWRSNAVFLPHF